MNLLESLPRIIDSAQRGFYRLPIVISGERDWCMEALSSIEAMLRQHNTLVVSQHEILDNTASIPATKLKSSLGTEYQYLVWDGFSGFSPDGLGAASGLVKGGGLFIFMVPPLSKLALKPDPDYIRMCSDGADLSRANTFFLQRLVEFFESEPCVLFDQANDCHALQSLPNREYGKQELPTADQQEAIKAILHVVDGHRNRPLVITADRGRGKSSALGLAAAELAIAHRKRILITAPSKRACANASYHFEERIKAEGLLPKDYQQYLQFLPPDELLASQPPCQLLMIDEAAGIPAPVLSQLLGAYSRIVFSSTIHGYEGNGRGFGIRFKKHLDQQTPGWKHKRLEAPVRWADNDPLENWICQLLFLSLDDAHFSAAEPIQSECPPTKVARLSQAELFENPDLLSRIFHLLVNAHYQTSPDDIRLLLDHPDIYVACAFSQDSRGGADTLIGAILMIQEGKLEDEVLTEQILSGKRRLRGHLVAQSLATYSGQTSQLEQRSLRVMRIAVKSEFENHGVGSALIEHAYQLAKNLGFDSLGTAFGLTTELVSFWHKNNFSLLKLGVQRDNASGCYSAVMQRPISERSTREAKKLEDIFAGQLLIGCSRQFRNHSTNTLLNAIWSANFPGEALKLDERELKQLKRFSSDKLSIEDCMQELITLSLQHFKVFRESILDETAVKLVIRRVLQAYSITSCVTELKLDGKKQLDEHLRKAAQAMLEHY